MMSSANIRKKIARFFVFIPLLFSFFYSMPAANADGNGLQWYWRTDTGATTGSTYGAGQLTEFGAGTAGLCHSQTGGDINWRWALASPGGSCAADGFTTFGTGYLRATWTGTHYFCAQSDDGFWLRINSSNVISNWVEQGARTGQNCNAEGQISLTKNQTYSIKVFHHENAGGADMRLLWKYDVMENYEIVPQKFLSTANNFDASLSISSNLPSYNYGNTTYNFGFNINSNSCGVNQTSSCNYSVTTNNSFSPLSYSLVGSLPTILKVDSSTGSIQYNPSGTFTSGTYSNLQIRATDPYGATFDSNEFSINIIAQPLTIKAADKTATYNGAAATINNSYSITSGSLLGSDTFTALTYRYTSASPSYNSTTAPTNAGVYTITPSAANFTVGSLSGYSITYDTGTLTIARASQSALALSSTSSTYLTNLKLLTTGGSDIGVVSFSVDNSGTAGCSISNSDSLTSTTAGTCQVVATKAGTSNYLPTYDTQTITFSKASLGLGISLTGSSLVKYGDTTTVTYSTNRSLGSAGIANLTGSISYSTESSNSCSVNSSTGVITMVAGSGACSVKVALSSDTNYLDTSSATVSVTPRKADTLTVTTTEPTPLTYTGSSVGVTPSITVSGLVNNDSAAGATFTYSRATTCATGGACVVGDTGPGGGIVFYVSESAINAADSISTGGLYLEAAPSTFSKTTFTWCTGFTNSNTTTIGGTSSAIGTGAMNTKIVSSMCSGGAVYEAANLTLGGKSDWFLPSAGELLQMYNQKSILGFGTGTTAAGYLYWGSNETENWVAASLVPANGVGGQNKAQATPYWPIRAFSPSATTYSPSTTAPTNAGSYTITSSVLTLSGGRLTDNYLSVIYDTSTLTIDKANQSIFSNYSSLEAVLGSAFTIYPFGGSGDGAVYLSISNGTATGCSATTASVTASTAGTCVLTVTKSANENYNQAQSSFAITFFYFVPAPTPQVSTTPTHIAIDAPTAWSAVATAAPEITSFTPSSGPVGTVVTVTGTGFDGVTSVKIGRKALITVNGVDSTTLTAVIPAGTTSGPIVVTNEYGSDFSDSNFTVTFVDTP